MKKIFHKIKNNVLKQGFSSSSSFGLWRMIRCLELFGSMESTKNIFFKYYFSLHNIFVKPTWYCFSFPNLLYFSITFSKNQTNEALRSYVLTKGFQRDGLGRPARRKETYIPARLGSASGPHGLMDMRAID